MEVVRVVAAIGDQALEAVRVLDQCVGGLMSEVSLGVSQSATDCPRRSQIARSLSSGRARDAHRLGLRPLYHRAPTGAFTKLLSR